MKTYQSVLLAFLIAFFTLSFMGLLFLYFSHAESMCINLDFYNYCINFKGMFR